MFTLTFFRTDIIHVCCSLCLRFVSLCLCLRVVWCVWCVWCVVCGVCVCVWCVVSAWHFDIQLGMWTCGNDTSCQFGERLLVHVLPPHTQDTSCKQTFRVPVHTQGTMTPPTTFGERLVVHVENQSANRWKDCAQCCGSHSGRHVAGHVPRFLSVLEHCTCQNFLCELI